MGSVWGNSWGDSWGNSWGSRVVPPVPPPPTPDFSGTGSGGGNTYLRPGAVSSDDRGRKFMREAAKELADAKTTRAALLATLADELLEDDY